MDVHVDVALLQPAIALIAGILVLIVPRLLNYVVALYLILLGLSGLWPHLLRAMLGSARHPGGNPPALPCLLRLYIVVRSALIRGSISRGVDV